MIEDNNRTRSIENSCQRAVSETLGKSKHALVIDFANVIFDLLPGHALHRDVAMTCRLANFGQPGILANRIGDEERFDVAAAMKHGEHRISAIDLIAPGIPTRPSASRWPGSIFGRRSTIVAPDVIPDLPRIRRRISGLSIGVFVGLTALGGPARFIPLARSLRPVRPQS
jgi:hypothetical protein